MRLDGNADRLATGAPVIAADSISPVPEFRRVIFKPRDGRVGEWKAITGAIVHGEI